MSKIEMNEHDRKEAVAQGFDPDNDEVVGCFYCKKCGDVQTRECDYIVSLLVSKDECEMKCKSCDERTMHRTAVAPKGCLCVSDGEVLSCAG